MFLNKFSYLYHKHSAIRYALLKLTIIAFIAMAFGLSQLIRLAADYKLDDTSTPPESSTSESHNTKSYAYYPNAIGEFVDKIISPKILMTERPLTAVKMNIAEQDLTSTAPDNNISYEVVVNKGDTLLHILRNHETNKDDITKLLLAIKKHKGKIHLSIGQTIKLVYETEIIDDDGDLTSERQSLKEIQINSNASKQVHFTKQDNQFVIEKKNIILSKVLARKEAKIEGTLMSTLKTMGIKSSHIIELINAYSHQIDFQRQIRGGDSVTITYEKFLTANKEFSHYGKIIHASLELSGKNYDVYRYKPSSKSSAEFFTPEGKGVKRSLLRTPIKVVRISSRYGRRKHPVLGYTKMHTGVDFAAPTGTPIYAAGDGVITRIGWNGGYGRFIQIKHNGTLSTAYGHASKFAKGMKKGTHIKQGQIIAYVGKTGTATGPHLHYEIRINGKHTNPMKYKTTAGKQLKGKQLESFKEFQKDIGQLNEKLASSQIVPEATLRTIYKKVA